MQVLPLGDKHLFGQPCFLEFSVCSAVFFGNLLFNYVL
ncbi:hypothetical protein HNQ59_002690 [Chitinivorax tropicus]|uniref:Uncharacterized protein n=1 Tax=Chitinivorax tropicus TaxID=714531 RepID=A0A840MQN4_9PROT|nr:hypothetical protein [Chitinivorax tropicus]